jgi:hypothetical protein
MPTELADGLALKEQRYSRELRHPTLLRPIRPASGMDATRAVPPFPVGLPGPEFGWPI